MRYGYWYAFFLFILLVAITVSTNVEGFFGGESFAVLQCWMECAIEHTDHMFASPAFQTKLRALKSIAS